MNIFRFPSELAAGVLLTALLPVSSRAQGLSSARPADITPPSFVTTPVLTPNADANTPLAARIAFQTDEPTSITLTIKDGERSWQVLAEAELKTNHQVAVLGVRFGLTHRIAVIARDAAGNETTAAQELVFVTPTAPTDTPPFHLIASSPDQMEPGITLMNVTIDRFHPAYLVAVDPEGEIVWYHRTERFAGDLRQLRNGNLLFLYSNFGMVEMNFFGEVENEWYASKLWPDRAPDGAILVDTDTFHHEVFEMPSNEVADFVVVSTELRVYPNYPSNEVDPTQTVPSSNVILDTIVEFTRDGTIVRELKLADLLDPYRICYDSLFDFWNTQYGLSQTDDWAHVNAVVFDPYDETYVISLRHQESVIKIDRATGQLVWILGPHERWQPQFQPYLLTPVSPGFSWNYHQHAPEWTPHGTIIMFDNGNQRAVPPAPPLPLPQRWSRAIEVRVDATAKTVEELWAFGGPPPAEQFYSNTRGDADYQLLTGNVLVTDSDRQPAQPGGASWSRIVEVTHTSPPVAVFDLHMRDDNLADGVNPWNSYRAERIASLYPQ